LEVPSNCGGLSLSISIMAPKKVKKARTPKSGPRPQTEYRNELHAKAAEMHTKYTDKDQPYGEQTKFWGKVVRTISSKHTTSSLRKAEQLLLVRRCVMKPKKDDDAVYKARRLLREAFMHSLTPKARVNFERLNTLAAIVQQKRIAAGQCSCHDLADPFPTMS
jgi:hypothetical protein